MNKKLIIIIGAVVLCVAIILTTMFACFSQSKKPVDGPVGNVSSGSEEPSGGKDNANNSSLPNAENTENSDDNDPSGGNHNNGENNNTGNNTSNSGNNAQKPDYYEKYNWIKRPLPESVKYDFSNETALERPKKNCKKEIQYIDLEGCSWADLMMMTTLQGNVNRDEPSMYILHNYIVEGIPGFDASRYWFDKLDEDYTGNEAYTKKKYTDMYQMIYDNLSSIKGIVLYHDRLTDQEMRGVGAYGKYYSDIALLNLTLMMCGQYDSIALTVDQYYKMKEYLLTKGVKIEDRLPLTGDTTLFMKKDGNGDYSPVRNDRETWAKVYQYALNKFGNSVSKKVMVHNPGFQAANFDYIVANRLFTYNRIFSEEATEAEHELELDMLSLTDDATPVIGVWYLQKDESTYVPFVNDVGKYFVVTYESFNLSWTTGLPTEEVKIKEEEIKLDTSKVYIALNFTEGDNNSYLHFKMPLHYDDKNKGAFPFNWAMAPTVLDLNPNIVRHLNNTWSKGDGLTVAEAGIDYVDHTPPAEYREKFFAWSDEYMKRFTNGNMRVLNHDRIDALPYAEYMSNLDSVLVGYGPTSGTSSYDFNNDKNDFLFRGVPFISQYSGREPKEVINAEFAAPNFISYSLSGWDGTLAEAKDMIEKLDSRYQVVTEKQLASLYRQYYEKQYTDVTYAQFSASMTRDEMAYLYKASNYNDLESFSDNYRFANEKDFFIYKFDLNDNVTEAKLNLLLSGDYSIEMSNDNYKWYQVKSGSLWDKTGVSINIPKFLLKSKKPIYVRFGDATEDTGDGVALYELTLSTNLSDVDNVVDIDVRNDDAFHVSGDKAGVDGRTGIFTYLVNFASDVTTADIAVLADENVTLMVSADNKNFTEVKLSQSGNTQYGILKNLKGKTYLKFSTDGYVSRIKVNPYSEGINSTSFSPVGGRVDNRYALYLDDTSVSDQYASSFRKLSDNQSAIVYRFIMAPGISNATLQLNITGLYKVDVSNDNSNYTNLFTMKLGDDDPGVRKIDISRFATSGQPVYVRISKSANVGSGNILLKKIRILTDKTEQYLLDKIAIENRVEAIVFPSSEQEIALIDKTLSTAEDTYGIYVGSGGVYRKIEAAKDGKVVYKLDFNQDNADYWGQLGLNLAETKLDTLGVGMNVLNSYKIETSADGSTWTTIKEVDTVVRGGTNKELVKFDLTEQLKGGTENVAYIRFSRGASWNGSDEALMLDMAFYFNN